ncbi:MAG: hypothetical protein M3R36_17765 [Bacteroidota bacterium]|nr:hypothetical protein [Bacteroidota bacterium]
MGSSRNNFMTLNPKKIAIKEILAQLEKIVNVENLNETNNTALAIEKIQAILFYYSEKFGFEKISYSYKSPYIQPLLPLNILDLSNKIKIKLARGYIADQRVLKMKSEGQNSFSEQEFKTIFNEEEIEREALELIRSKKDFPMEKVGIDSTLHKYLNVLLLNKTAVIDKSYLPLPDLSEQEAYDRSMKLTGQYSTLSKIYFLYSNEQ